MLIKKPTDFKHFYLSYILMLSLPILPFIVGAKVQWATHVLLIFTLILESRKLMISKYGKWIVLLVISIIVSFYTSLSAEYNLIIQSLFYLLTPYLMIVLGIQMGVVFKKESDILKYIVYHGTVGAMLFLIVGIFTAGSALFNDIYQLRHIILWGSITNVIAIIILLFHNKLDQVIVQKASWRKVFIVINILALALTASRTYYLIFFIFLLLVLFRYRKTAFLSISVILCLVMVFILSIETDNLFILKIQNAVSEISNTREFSGYDDVGAYYRAYETQQAMKTYNSGTEAELIFGHGLDKLVDLNIYVDLAGTERRFIPVLHNGYAYLLIRTGILGVILFGLFFLRAFFIKIINSNTSLYYLIYLGTLISLIISNYVIGSFFSSEMFFGWVIVGLYFLLASKPKLT